MNLTTRFSINSPAYFVRVKLEVVNMACLRCKGEGTIEAREESGVVHHVVCPATLKKWDDDERCHRGWVKAGVRYVADIRKMTVGQIRVTLGGISGNSNMGDLWQQTYEQHEEVMCYETGIGSGSIYHTEARVGPGGATCCFTTEEEAQAWGDQMVRDYDTTLKMDLIHEAALAEDLEHFQLEDLERY